MEQVLSVLVITAGAGLTTLGCYSGSQAAAMGKSAATNAGVVVPGSDPTPPHVFLVGLALLVGNLLNDSGKDVLQVTIG
jgi:flagellar basal body-associated protein FliL